MLKADSQKFHHQFLLAFGSIPILPKDTEVIQKPCRNLFSLRSSLTRRCANASYPAGSPPGDASNVANAALTAVAHGGKPQDRAASPLCVYVVRYFITVKLVKLRLFVLVLG